MTRADMQQQSDAPVGAARNFLREGSEGSAWAGGSFASKPIANRVLE
jgi:hypothetical protein